MEGDFMRKNGDFIFSKSFGNNKNNKDLYKNTLDLFIPEEVDNYYVEISNLLLKCKKNSNDLNELIENFNKLEKKIDWYNKHLISLNRNQEKTKYLIKQATNKIVNNDDLPNELDYINYITDLIKKVYNNKKSIEFFKIRYDKYKETYKKSKDKYIDYKNNYKNNQTNLLNNIFNDDNEHSVNRIIINDSVYSKILFDLSNDIDIDNVNKRWFVDISSEFIKAKISIIYLLNDICMQIKEEPNLINSIDKINNLNKLEIYNELEKEFYDGKHCLNKFHNNIEDNNIGLFIIITFNQIINNEEIDTEKLNELLCNYNNYDNYTKTILNYYKNYSNNKEKSKLINL